MTTDAALPKIKPASLKPKVQSVVPPTSSCAGPCQRQAHGTPGGPAWRRPGAVRQDVDELIGVQFKCTN